MFCCLNSLEFNSYFFWVSNVNLYAFWSRSKVALLQTGNMIWFLFISCSSRFGSWRSVGSGFAFDVLAALFQTLAAWLEWICGSVCIGSLLPLLFFSLSCVDLCVMVFSVHYSAGVFESFPNIKGFHVFC